MVNGWCEQLFALNTIKVADAKKVCLLSNSETFREMKLFGDFIGSKRHRNCVQALPNVLIEPSKTQSNGAKWQHPLNAPPAFLRPRFSDSNSSPKTAKAIPQANSFSNGRSTPPNNFCTTFSDHRAALEKGIIKTKKMLIIGIQTL